MNDEEQRCRAFSRQQNANPLQSEADCLAANPPYKRLKNGMRSIPYNDDLTGENR
ncbi:hypothetical protein [Methylomicrobium album]|uniref:hypothetical protein n=1 Tax=Methylomicrobium album TaxID=39775 RepID=UPI00031CAD14|nr:hypothetical protein [Methylomicrobium album]